MVFLYFLSPVSVSFMFLCFYVCYFGGGRTACGKGVPECRPGTPGREGGSNAGHERIYMTPQIFNIFLSKLI